MPAHPDVRRVAEHIEELAGSAALLDPNHPDVGSEVSLLQSQVSMLVESFHALRAALPRRRRDEDEKSEEEEEDEEDNDD